MIEARFPWLELPSIQIHIPRPANGATPARCATRCFAPAPALAPPEAASATLEHAAATVDPWTVFRWWGNDDLITAEDLRLPDFLGPDAAEQARRCERLRDLKCRLPAVLDGKDRPADAPEMLAFADLCYQPFLKRYAAAARSLSFDEFHQR